MSDERAMVAVDAQALIAQGIEKGLSIDGMERLLTMRRELREEAAREAYFAALSNFQAACPTIPKTKIVLGKDRKERYRYASIDAIVGAVRDALRDHGFSYTVETVQTPGDVTAVVKVHHRDGHREESRFTAPIDTTSYMSAPQQVAAALTYAKRYALCDALGIVTGDEDIDAAPEEHVPEPQAQPKMDTDLIEKALRKRVDDALLDEMINHEQHAKILSAIVKYHGTDKMASYAQTIYSNLDGIEAAKADEAKPAGPKPGDDLIEDAEVSKADDDDPGLF